MSFNEGDSVKVTEQGHSMHGKTGTVTLVYCDGQAFSVKFAEGRESGFFLSELELVDAKREALIELADTLDKARLQANAIDEYVIQSQHGVYGTIAMALHDTLGEIVGHDYDATRYAHSDRVYDSILDGNPVREALKVVGK
jgi:hypothetical protein